VSAGSVDPIVSVVVATHGRAGLLPRLVHAIEQQSGCGSIELVIVDDASPDTTWAQLERLRGDATIPLQIHRLPQNRGPATARNIGWRAASARLIAFTDDDCTPSPDWLAAIVAGLGTHAIVQGRTLPDPAQDANRGPFSHTMHVKGENGLYATCNIGYRREVLERVGGFDESFRWPYGEDIDLAWRAKEAGATTAFVRDAVVHHDIRPASVKAHLRDLRRRSGIVQVVRSHPALRSRFPQRLFVRPTHPQALLAAAGLAVALSSRPLAVRLAGLALVGPYVHSFRVGAGPVDSDTHLAHLPLSLISDLAEIGVLAAASVRERTLVL